jgi:hypothetical protein
MYIAKREGPSGSFLYYKEDTRWTGEKSEAKLFETECAALSESDFTGLYEVILEKI